MWTDGADLAATIHEGFEYQVANVAQHFEPTQDWAHESSPTAELRSAALPKVESIAPGSAGFSPFRIRST